MVRDEQAIRQTNKTLDRVLSCGPGVSVPWLRAAFHTHEDQMHLLLETNRSLRAELVKHAPRPLTVELARMCHVCRLCAEPLAGGACVFNFGEEHVHRACLDREQTDGACD